MRCAKHEEETSVSCGRCEAPVCPKCMVHTDVGVRCANCAPDRGKPLYSMTKGRAVVAGAIILILVIGGLGLASDGLGISSSQGDSYYDEYDDYIEEFMDADISVSSYVDPWTSDDGELKAAPGQRFVAIEILIENMSDSEIPYYASPWSFKLTDTDGFAYVALETGARPVVPAVSLAHGEKVRGWLTFEVDEDAEIATFSDSWSTIDLPD